MARAIAARRSASTTSSGRAAPAPARISAMIASGSSLRGLSEVTTATSASRRATVAHLRALAAVAVAAAAEHDQQAPAVHELAGRAQHVVERVGRVGVVDDHREGLAAVDRPRSARARPPRRATPARDGVVGQLQQLGRRPPRPSRLDEVEAPAQAASRRPPGRGA